jgi:hypothetical protein
MANRKRPRRLTLIAIMWFFSGLVIVYYNFKSINGNMGALLSLLDPTNTLYFHPWCSVGLPVWMLLNSIFIVSGILQLITALVLWTRKAYSYKLALGVLIIQGLASAFWVWLWATSSRAFMPEPDRTNFIAEGVAALIWSILWAGIFWVYLGKPYVKAFRKKSKSKQKSNP